MLVPGTSYTKTYLSGHLRRDDGKVGVLPLRRVFFSGQLLLLPELARSLADGAARYRGRRILRRELGLTKNETRGFNQRKRRHRRKGCFLL